ncbi:MAG TPA: DUF192 domain-containing protein [Pirellulaceae bacterium]|nr:DUF192 domain-containing protein [Pirellulaceae bacterium]
MSATILPKLFDATTGAVVIDRLEIATNFWQRLRGWQFRSRPPTGTGILLAPCNAVHTFGMRFDIDIAFLDRIGKVIAVKSRIVPWRFVLPVVAAQAVLEIPSGQGHVSLGQTLAIAGTRELALPHAVHALIKGSMS